MDWLQLLLGGVLLYFGAEWFVAGASALALALRVPQIIVGLTVVAYGTSAPEVVVGVQAALMGHGAVTLGNVIGSNIANIGLILGLAALVRPARVDATLQKRELPVLVLSALCVPVVLADGVVSRLEGALLLLLGGIYTAWMVQGTRAATAIDAAAVGAGVEVQLADAAGAPRPLGRGRAGATAVFGLVLLLVGGNLFVHGAVEIARALGMSERMVGLTVIALGTSLPELVTSVIAARRGHSDLAVGNVIGSNIYNVLLCLGAAAGVRELQAPGGVQALDLIGMLGMTLLAAFSIRSERIISRAEGTVILGIYLLLMGWTIAGT